MDSRVYEYIILYTSVCRNIAARIACVRVMLIDT